MDREQRQAFRDRHYPVGMRCEVRDEDRTWVLGEIIDNTGVMLLIRLDDGREQRHYDHLTYAPDPDRS